MVQAPQVTSPGSLLEMHNLCGHSLLPESESASPVPGMNLVRVEVWKALAQRTHPYKSPLWYLDAVCLYCGFCSLPAFSMKQSTCFLWPNITIQLHYHWTLESPEPSIQGPGRPGPHPPPSYSVITPRMPTALWPCTFQTDSSLGAFALVISA